MKTKIFKLKMSEDEIQTLQFLSEEMAVSKGQLMRLALKMYATNYYAATSMQEASTIDMLPQEFRALSAGELG